VTVSALIAMNRPDQLRAHLARARDNRVTQDELVEAITTWRRYLSLGTFSRRTEESDGTARESRRITLRGRTIV
jgi:hypothetical protein